MDFKAIAASLPKRQRRVFHELALFAAGAWVPTQHIANATDDPCAGQRLAELEDKGLVKSRDAGRSCEWRMVRNVVTGREHLLHLLRGLKAMVDAPPPPFALSEEQSKLLDEVNAVLSEGTKRRATPKESPQWSARCAATGTR